MFSKKTTPQVDLQDDNPKIRIQFDQFQIIHFDIAPIWEFASDEEGEDGQDETTLRPIFGSKVADPADGLYIVKTEFQTSSGKKYFGVCSPALEFKLGEIQPYMYADNDLIPFWYGMLEPDKAAIDSIYKQLGETKDTFFPIKFEAMTETKGAKLSGQLDGFMWKPIDGEKIITIK